MCAVVTIGVVDARVKALVVPLVVLAVWFLPSSRPEVMVAGATAVRDAAPLADVAPITVLDTLVTSTLPTSLATSTTTIAAPPVPSTADSVVPVTTTVVLAAPETTSAPTTTIARSIGELALERVAYDWRGRFPDWQVEFEPAREGLRALTYPAERRIEVFVRTSDTPATLHRVFAHELGHLIDVELNDDGDRARWFDVRGIAQETPWWPSASAPDFDTGAGDFAEAFAVWETGVSSRSTVGGQPDADDLAVLRELAA